MAYNATELITDAYDLSGIVARDYETVSGSQVSAGLRMLNALLAIKTVESRLIPYFTLYEFNTVAGTADYFIAGLISIETMTFNLQEVRFSMQNLGRKAFFNTPSVDNITSLPYSGRVEREKGGTRIYFYYVPDDVYVIKLMGKFSLASVTLATNLETTLDAFYIEYLRYALAGYICDDNKIPFAQQPKLTKYEALITDVSPMDMTVTKISSFRRQSGVNWGTANLSNGWTTP